MRWLKKIALYFSALKTVLARQVMLMESRNHQLNNRYITFPEVKLNNSEIGKFTYIADNSIIHNCTIGKFSSIGPNVVVGYGEHPPFFLSTSPIFYQRDKMFSEHFYSPNDFNGKTRVYIGSDVWIGASAYIKNGITIGDGAIVGAGAIVTKDVPPYAIVVGVPAKIIKYRFDAELVKKLLQVKWWDWPEDKINRQKKYFTKNNIQDDFFNENPVN